MAKKYISSKEVINKYRLSYSLLNYYTNIGLFQVIRRKGNVRYYDEDELRARRLKITRLLNEGYPLRIVRKMLDES